MRQPRSICSFNCNVESNTHTNTNTNIQMMDSIFLAYYFSAIVLWLGRWINMRCLNWFRTINMEQKQDVKNLARSSIGSRISVSLTKTKQELPIILFEYFSNWNGIFNTKYKTKKCNLLQHNHIIWIRICPYSGSSTNLHSIDTREHHQMKDRDFV